MPNPLKTLFLFLFTLVYVLALSAAPTAGAPLCSQVFTARSFESLKSSNQSLDFSDLGSRTFLYDLREAFSRLEEGTAQQKDLLVILQYGDPVSIAATLKWSQPKTESVLWDIVRLLESPNIQPQVLAGDIVTQHFFRENLTPWFDLVPQSLLSRLVVASLGGRIAEASSLNASAILGRLPELQKVLGVESPVILELALRAVQKPRSLSLAPEIHRFPEQVQQQFTENWRVNSEQPELVLPGVSLLSHAAKSQLVQQKDWVDCGTCPYMARGHFEPFFKNNAGQGTTLVLQQGELLGLLKTTGDPSFLALRDIKNERGDRVLLTGGVYVPPLWMLNKIQVSVHPMAPHPLQTLDLSSFKIDTMGKDPLAFYPMVFSKAPLELNQILGGMFADMPSTEGSIRESYGFSMGPVENVKGQEFKNGILELRDRAQAVLDKGL